MSVLLALLISLLPSSADACSLLEPDPLRVTVDPTDGLAPLRPVVERTTITRGTGPRIEDGRIVRTSCDDVGWITLGLRQPADDPHPAGEIGYLLELESGALPDGMVLPQIPWKGPTLVLPWLDVMGVRERAVELSLRITPVDVAANRGAPLVVSVTDRPEPEPTGCAHTGNRGLVGWFLALLLVARRRHRA